MVESETPLKNRIGFAYQTGASPATPPLELEKDVNWRSTGNGNIRRQRTEAHAQAVESEERHYNQIHPFVKPKPKW